MKVAFDTGGAAAQAGADVNRGDETSATPLHAACGDGRESHAQLLLERGAHVDRTTSDGITPLYTACAGGA